MNRVTQEEFEKLYSDTITKKEYDEIIQKIDERFSEIIYLICPALKKRGWFDYGNCDYRSEDSGGHFDPQRYKVNIKVGGENVTLPEPWGWEYQIPTRWLWSNNEVVIADFQREIDDYKKQQQKEQDKKRKRQEKKEQQREQLRRSIKDKLTKEELKVIQFK